MIFGLKSYLELNLLLIKYEGLYDEVNNITKALKTTLYNFPLYLILITYKGLYVSIVILGVIKNKIINLRYNIVFFIYSLNRLDDILFNI